MIKRYPERAPVPPPKHYEPPRVGRNRRRGVKPYRGPPMTRGNPLLPAFGSSCGVGNATIRSSPSQQSACRDPSAVSSKPSAARAEPNSTKLVGSGVGTAASEKRLSNTEKPGRATPPGSIVIVYVAPNVNSAEIFSGMVIS